METETEQRAVANADIIALSEVWYLMQDIVSLEKRREWQRERMSSMAQHLSGMPGGGAPAGLDTAFAEVSELEERHRMMVERYCKMLSRAEAIINGIENTSMQTFVRMMYLDNVPAREVRMRLNMTRRTFERARKAVEQAPNMASVKWRDHFFLKK